MYEPIYRTGRSVIMTSSWGNIKKDTFGKVVKYCSDTKCVTVKWENNIISDEPSHWVGTFSCDEME